MLRGTGGGSLPSKWISEEVWLKALSYKAQHIKECGRPGTVFYHRNVLDPAFTKQYIEKQRRSFERIKAAGEPEWQERYDAKRSKGRKAHR